MAWMGAGGRGQRHRAGDRGWNKIIPSWVGTLGWVHVVLSTLLLLDEDTGNKILAI